MATTHERPAPAAELGGTLNAADPAVLLVSPRLLCRIIKQHRQIAGLGLQVPHRRCYVIDRKALLQIVTPHDLGLRDGCETPPTLILIAHPNSGRGTALPTQEVLQRCWRLLFHARVHAALEQQLASGSLTPADIRQRIQRIGATEFEEIRRVLQQEHHLLPPGDDCTTYVEFAALYLGLRCFAARLVPCYFPALGDHARIDALLAEDVNASALFAGLGPECAPDPSGALGSLTAEPEDLAEEAEEPSATAEDEPPAAQSARAVARLLQKADQAEAMGNTVRAAILRARAEPAAAQAELNRLAGRLQAALALTDQETAAWSAALPGLLRRSLRGFWTVEARLLYDLQKVCVDHERGVYKADLLGWILRLGRRPLHRALPGQQRVRVVRHLRSAARRLLRARLADADRRLLASLIGSALHHTEERLRGYFRPFLREALDEVGLRPANVPEEVARHKLIEELLDRIVERGFLNLGDLRDALSRNQLKLPDLSGPAECVRGDPLLRLDRRLAVSMDGVYRGGEVYLRVFQRFSSLAFGTRAGRFLTRYVVLPFGGAFIILKALSELVEMFSGHAALFRQAAPLVLTGAVGAMGSGPGPGSIVYRTSCALYLVRLQRDLDLATWLPVVVLGLFLFGLLHVSPFRRTVAGGLRLLGRGLRAVVVEGPAWILRQPVVRTVLDSEPVAVFRRHLLTPLLCAALGGGAALGFGDGWLMSGLIGTGVFVGAVLFCSSRLGRDIGEAVADELARTWRRLSADFFPALFHWIMDFFKFLLDQVERLLYAVDEWLRFKEGDNRWRRGVKAILGLIWGVVTYVVRFALTVLVEPQINPIKHFPVVTVSHKLLLPLAFTRHVKTVPSQLAEMLLKVAPLSIETANVVVATVVWGIPGIFGFLAWELKENWRLYQANRPPTLRPVAIGHHGETMLRLLRPGFHSGTIPRLFAKLRRAERRSKRKAARKVHEALHEVSASVRHFVERELLELLRQSRGWAQLPVTVGAIRLGTNRIRVELRRPDREEAGLWLEFAEHSGLLIARIAQPGWLTDLDERHRQILRTALAGLYKLAAVSLVGEPPDEPACQPQVLDATKGRFANVSIQWPEWVAVWERDQSGKELDEVLLPGIHLLGPDREILPQRSPIGAVVKP